MLRFPRRMPGTGQRGTALIEFALVLPMLILLTFLVVDLSRAFMMRSVLDQAAREGARCLGADSTSTRAVASARNLAAAVGYNPDSVQVTYDQAGAKGDPVTVSVSAKFTWLYPGVLQLFGWQGASTITLTGTNKCYREW